MTPALPQIKNIVFLMMENRSLDNVLGWLYSGRTPRNFFPSSSSKMPYDGLAAGRYSNPATTLLGELKHYPVVPVPGDLLASNRDRVPWSDPTEEFKKDDWNGVMNQLFGNQEKISGLPPSGRTPGMQGFLQDYYSRYMTMWQGLDILWTYTPSQLPTINGLASSFAVSDRWFSSAPTQTNPNRAYSICGTSCGHESNLNWLAKEQFNVPTVFNRLAAAGKSWGLYYSGLWLTTGQCYTSYTFPQIGKPANCEIGTLDLFKANAKNGTLKDFTYLEPTWGGGKAAIPIQGTDYHPPAHVLPADAFLKEIYQAIRSSPQWKQTLFIVTFDEHGGTYDHVPPPWGAINPDGKRGESGFNFDLFGVRVPTILISPFITPGTVFRAPEGSTYPFDHTSFIKTFLLWAGVDPDTANLGNRMPKAPSFEGVLNDTPANDARLDLEPPPSVAASSLAEVGLADTPQSEASEPVNALLEGVPFAIARAIVTKYDTIDAIQSAVSEFKRDPDRFEASL